MLKILRFLDKGQRRGRKIGFPTLNFALKKGDKIKRGVWLGKLKIRKKEHFGVLNVGMAKTFDEREEKIEVHLLSKPPKMIKKAEIYFLKYLRKTKKFKTIEELKKQIKKDIEKGLFFLELLKKK